ncbi:MULTISPECIES: hypothetical protein [unclassified Sulfuricurvum]|uniref:hypothetical protein n=1 Tax=unclassified Sulfuricurvum TaxID=2632390 RepID=UPI0025E576DD|nr:MULTISPECIES: hypothetical protein [unclassified Sulfuricurvum]
MTPIMRVTVVALLAAMPIGMMAEESPGNYRMGPGYGMMGYGYGGGYGPCEECGTYHMRGNNDDGYRAMSEKEAKEKFDAYVSKHLKGYTMGKMEKQRMPMGTMYWVIVKDKNGNEMELHMNPWGYIRGPFIK